MQRTLRHRYSRWKADLFREPGTPSRYPSWGQGGWRHSVFGLLVSGYGIVYALFGFGSIPMFPLLALSTAIFLWAAAELLPKERTKLAGGLRALAWASSWVGILVALPIYLTLAWL